MIKKAIMHPAMTTTAEQAKRLFQSEFESSAGANTIAVNATNI